MADRSTQRPEENMLKGWKRKLNLHISAVGEVGFLRSVIDFFFLIHFFPSRAVF